MRHGLNGRLFSIRQLVLAQTRCTLFESNIWILLFRRHWNGGQGWNRTTDTRIFSPLLYRLSYLALFEKALLLDAMNGALRGVNFEPREQGR